MAVPNLTPNMQLPLSTVGIAIDYPESLLAAFAKINAHTHSDGLGKSIDEKSINWTQFDGEFKAIFDIGALNFIPASPQPTDPLALYFFTDVNGSDLYFNNNAGTPIRITRNGHVNNLTSVNGFTGDFKSFNAAAVFSNTNNAYTFSSVDGLSNLLSSELDFSGAGSTIDLTNAFVANFAATNFTINSPAFFFDNDLICFSNFNLQPQPFTSFTRTQSPRVISSGNQVANTTTDFPIRYILPANGASVTPISFDTLGATLVTVNFIQGSFYASGGNSAYVYQSCQDGYRLGVPFNGTTIRLQNNGAGSVFGITPSYDAQTTVDQGKLDIIRVEIGFSQAVWFSPTFVPRMPQLCIINNDATYIPVLQFFREDFIQFTETAVANRWIISCTYTIQVFKAGTNVKTNNYHAILRL